ncbi:response regulator [Streptomyces sp. NEAU-W12]|uniref:response regulator n=1 Tax=Streptomyces sp. NEAU-W12 TaxID=2994668 RepID=UPI00224A4C63|nr:response regulator [Streptomyces sp. NEAU-W12]MCX2923105.1 response regulator [Streptomyces sp. NEAU-W12]
MPGKDFAPRITPQETASLTDAAVGDLAQRLAHRLLETPSHPAPDDPAQALALLRVLNHLKQATERLQQEAAVAAARAGAGYPQIGAACGMTRQGARRRWPGLFHHSPEKPTEHPTMTTPTRPFDVLLVEDDIADAMLIEEALSERGARNLVQVTDGVAALEHLRAPDSPRPDLIVLDLNMPRMNGRDLLKVLKSDDDLQTIPVVVLTTSTAPDDVTGAYSSHANAYVTKPVNLEEFEQAVQSIDAFYLDTATRPRP